jgi:hypothetical protein
MLEEGGVGILVGQVQQLALVTEVGIQGAV